MKYVILSHQTAEQFSECPKDPALRAAGMAYGEALRAAGIVVLAAGLQPPQTLTIVSMRDGKHDYLNHMPRVASYLLRDLSHPDLEPLRQWYETCLFQATSGIRAEFIRGIGR